MFINLKQPTEETALVIIAAKKEQQHKNQDNHTDAVIIVIATFMATTLLWSDTAFLRFTAIIPIIAHNKTSHR